MKRIKLFCLLFLLMLSIFAGVGSGVVSAETVDTNDEANPISTNVQEKCFIWSNRIFVFYCNGTYINYKSRSNLTSWSDEIAIRANTDGKYFSVWLEEDGSDGYIHYAATDYSIGDEKIYYRKGQLLSDGTISWFASEQSITWHSVLNGRMLEPYIATDSAGYPIIISCFEADSGNYWNTTVRRSSTKDGTWTTDWSRTWLYQEIPDWDNVFYINKIVPLTERKFFVFTVRGNSNGRSYYWDGSTWNYTDDGSPDIYSMTGLVNLATGDCYKWDAVAESGSDTVHVVYNRFNSPDYYFQHKKWNSSGWFWEDPNEAGDGSYDWSSATVPRLTLNYSDNTMRAYWLEYNGTSFLNNTVWYRGWDGSSWGTPAVWFTETDDIIEHEDFTSIYSSNYWGITYLTNATSVNVEAYWTPPLEQPPAGEYYDITTYIRINGYEPYTNVTFQIDGTTYANGQTASLFSSVYGDYHNLTGTSVTHLSFINWTVTGSLTVSDSVDPAAHLFVSGTGTLTEHLNATVAITHNGTTVTNFNADDWLFAEYRYYDFNTTYVLTNSYLDTCMWSFLDHASNNVTFYFTNSSTEGVLSASEDFALTGQNASYIYTWINLTDQYFTITISLWLKYKIIDTMYVDLYVFGNCSGYGMANSTDWWVQAQTDYMNLYAQGGAEELATSGDAGRLTGGDFFNLYAGNNSYALSEIYFRNLVHVKTRVTLKWNPEPYLDDGSIWRFGISYYARGEWVQGFYVRLIPWGYGAGTVNYAWFKLSLRIAYGANITEIVGDDIYCYYELIDNEDAECSFWIDFWFNKANASSLFGIRVTSYYYAVQDNAPGWVRWLTSNWGASHTNASSFVGFGILRDDDGNRLFSSEIELIKVWARAEKSVETFVFPVNEIRDIHTFDLTFNSRMTGIPTPSFEEPKMPSIAVGGLAGWLASAIFPLIAQLGSAFASVWTGVVWLLDEAIFWAFGVQGGFSGIVTFVVASFTTVVEFIALLAANILTMATAVANTTTWFFSNFFGVLWGIIDFLLLTPAFNIFTGFATIIGVSLAWLGGTTYTNGWGQVYDFSYLSNMTIPGTSFSGGISVFYIMFVCGFFIQILACIGTMGIEPIAVPVRLFWGVIMFVIKIIEILWDVITGIISLVVQVVHALRDIAPRPFGL